MPTETGLPTDRESSRPYCADGSGGLLDADDVLPDLARWRTEGLATALVTLVEVEGGGPRPVGAQMAVAGDGRFSGYLSGGCLEASVAAEAVAVIAKKRNRLVRYGKGSAYFDIALPCGSALDLYIDRGLSDDELRRMLNLRAARRPFALKTSMVTGAHTLVEEIDGQRTARRADVMTRLHLPRLRLLILGAGPAIVALARLGKAAGLDVDVATPDDHARGMLEVSGIHCAPMTGAAEEAAPAADAWTAVVVAFHEHEREPPLLAAFLATDAFYVGALGSRAVAEARRTKLMAHGVAEDAIARLRPMLGLIPGAKSQATLAAGVLADVLGAAKSRGLVD